jgi:hypothetical protein
MRSSLYIYDYGYGTKIETFPKLGSLSLIMFVFIIFSSCLPTTKPVYIDSSFDPAKLSKISILPAIDIRKDRSIELQEGWQQRVVKGYTAWPVERLLRYKGYKNLPISFEENFGEIKTISEYDLIDLDHEFIRKVGPDDAKWVLLFSVEDTAERLEMGKAILIENSGYLFDKSSGKLVWHHQTICEDNIPALGLGIGNTIANLLTAYSKKVEDVMKLCIGYEILYKAFPNYP